MDTIVPTTDRSARSRFLLVRAGTTTYAVPIERVKRILRSVRAFPVPGSRAVLVGLIQYNGEAVTVLDLCALAEGGDGSGAEDPLTLVVEAGPEQSSELIALSVHEALTVTGVDRETVTAAPDGVIWGETVIDGKVARFLDLAAIGGAGS